MTRTKKAARKSTPRDKTEGGTKAEKRERRKAAKKERKLAAQGAKEAKARIDSDEQPPTKQLKTGQEEGEKQAGKNEKTERSTESDAPSAADEEPSTEPVASGEGGGKRKKMD